MLHHGVVTYVPKFQDVVTSKFMSSPFINKMNSSSRLYDFSLKLCLYLSPDLYLVFCQFTVLIYYFR